MAVIDGAILKGRCVVIHESFTKKPGIRTSLNHMGIEKTKLLVCESIYWININGDIKKHIKLLCMS